MVIIVAYRLGCVVEGYGFDFSIGPQPHPRMPVTTRSSKAC